MRPSAGADSRDRILFHLKTKGPQSASRLAERLDISAVAARQHLHRLRDEGLVAARDERRGVGRPTSVWHLTSAADGRFPDNHADLTVEILAAAEAAFGTEGVQRLITARTKAQHDRYRDALPATTAPLRQRVAALAKLRDAEGYMASAVRQRDGSVLLVENHCPICAAARACTGLCAEELALFQAVVGEGVAVDRVEHKLEGARRCAYRFRPEPRSTSPKP